MPSKDAQELQEALNVIFEEDFPSPSSSSNLCKQYLVPQIKREAIGKQKGSNREAIGKQKGSKEVAIGKPIREQKGSTYSYFFLTGLQKKICDEIFNDLIETRGRTTISFSLTYWSEVLETTKKTAKNAIQRLVKKGVLIRSTAKKGPGGWCTFELAEEIYQEIIGKQKVSNKVATRKQKGSEKVSNPSSSSSSILTTTTSSGDKIHYEPLKKIGFTKLHLDRIIDKTFLTEEQIQESINAFAFDLSKNNKKSQLKKRPIDFFMGIMLKNGPYLPPENYTKDWSPPRQGTLQARKSSSQSSKPILSTAAEEEAFLEWKSKISEKELKEILPSFLKKMGGPGTEAFLRDYFKKMH